MRFSLLPLALLTSTVLADGASIVGAINKIANASLALNSTVSSFPAGPLGLLHLIPLLSGSIVLLNDINDGTKVAQASANLTFAETLQVAGAVSTLGTEVQSVLGTVVAAKSKFDADLIVSPLLLLSLKQQKTATDQLSAAVVAKVPAALQGLAGALTAPVDAAFNTAIAAYTGAI